MDQWPGYAAERMRLVRFLVDRRVPNPVVLTGDIHSNWVNDLRVDDRKPEEPVVATEFVGTSITSQFGRRPEDVEALKADNPHLRFADGTRRGYTRVEVTPQRLRVDLRALRSVTQPRAEVDTLASFVVDDGQPGAGRA